MSTIFAMCVEPEAAARITQLGIQKEVDCMLDYAVKHVRGIRRVEICLLDPDDMYDEPHLSANAYRALELWTDDHRDIDHFRDWKSDNFTPDVLWRFDLHIRPDWPDAR
jgi:hypothetical protein